MDQNLDLHELLKATARTAEFSFLVLSRMEQKIKDGSLSLSKFLKQRDGNHKKVKVGV